jgi:hypothetical protein
MTIRTLLKEFLCPRRVPKSICDPPFPRMPTAFGGEWLFRSEKAEICNVNRPSIPPSPIVLVLVFDFVISCV